jgi:hypothetical protein
MDGLGEVGEHLRIEEIGLRQAARCLGTRRALEAD